MSINRMILQNLKANLKHYYLYVFALMFSVALYFAFVTLQYDPALDKIDGSVKGTAAIRAASVLLVAIVAIFNLYANTIFIKRRSKEIGLFQLIGMTKDRIFRILSMENMILYFSSLVVGTFIGFSVSKMILMILFRITGVHAIAVLHFSTQALVQTFIVFGAVYLFIMIMNYTFIKRQTILSLFRVSSSTEIKVKRMSTAELFMGLAGLALVFAGYYVSSKLFGGDFTTINELFGAMTFILASVIIGTYLVYKGSVRMILSFIRKRKKGFLNVREVLSLSSIMFRMKSNAMLLTVITTVSALAIGLLSLSYISYYSAEKSAKGYVPDHFSITDTAGANRFTAALKEKGIAYRETITEVVLVHANIEDITDTSLKNMDADSADMRIAAISENSAPGMDVAAGEALFTGYNDLLQKFLPLKKTGQIKLSGRSTELPLTYLGLDNKHLISGMFTSGGLPLAVVDDSVFRRLQQDMDPGIQKDSNLYIGIEMENHEDVEAANEVFHQLGFQENRLYNSQLDMANSRKQSMGLIMFIVGFLGLTFLVTSGCILYFKQMDESEEERPAYTILRKLGFTQTDLLRGIQVKQIFNFGIPLTVGLCHSYFAVQSGWFLFGTELWTPMLIVMVLYTALYSIFGFLSVLHYKKVIRRPL